MKPAQPFTTLGLALLALAPTAARAQASEDYINSVCSPNTTSTTNLPPCISITNIAYACAPNGTSTLALDAHAQCMCHGSFFGEWAGCQSCLSAHGARTERDAAYYRSVIAVASSRLCGTAAAAAAPTADFAAIFSSAKDAVPYPTTGATALSDIKSGDTAVSLYYTATGSAGPGVITGSATAATASVHTLGTVGSSTRTDGRTVTEGVAYSPTSSKSSASSTSSSTNVAAPTGVVGGRGWLVAAAGGALMAAW